MSGFGLKRFGQIMEPEPGNPNEVEGVVNPAAVRGPDGELYLFARLASRSAAVRRAMVDKRAEHKRYIDVHGEDTPGIRDWKWGRNEPQIVTPPGQAGVDVARYPELTSGERS